MKSLNIQQIRQISRIDGVNSRKDFIQNLMVEEWYDNNCKGLIECYTGFGKSRAIVKIIQRINNENPEYNITIIAPTTNLVEDFSKKINEFDLKNVTCSTIQSYSRDIKNNIEKNIDVLIIDEAHTCANSESQFFSEVIPKTNYQKILCCSATYESNHLEYFKKLGLEVIFNIPVEDGVRMSLIPDYTTYCIPVKLLDSEKLEYIKIQKEYERYVSYFRQYSPINPIGAIQAVIKGKKSFKYEGIECSGVDHAKRIARALNTEHGSVIGVAMKWMGATSRRASFLNNSTNLLRGAVIILKRITDKTIVFCSGIDNINYMSSQLPNSVTYHSGNSAKLNKINLDKFENGDATYLLTAKKLDQGYNLENLRVGLQYSYTSKRLQFTQRSGRVQRFDPLNPTKTSVFICLYIDDFIHNDVKIVSQQKKWLVNSLKGRSFVEWITDINQIEL